MNGTCINNRTDTCIDDDQCSVGKYCDPVWQISTNKIVFLNSFKMKVSVIIGVIHMLFGVLLSVWNNKYFQRPMNIICEVIPQILFLSCMFGYMTLLIFHKWTAYTAGGFGEGQAKILSTERCAP